MEDYRFSEHYRFVLKKIEVREEMDYWKNQQELCSDLETCKKYQRLIDYLRRNVLTAIDLKTQKKALKLYEGFVEQVFY
jgi:hypothetical protein